MKNHFTLFAILFCLSTIAVQAQNDEVGALKALDNASYYWIDQKPSLRAETVYNDTTNFYAVNSFTKIMKREVFDGVEVMIDYTVAEAQSGQKIFKDVIVHYTDLCSNCDLNVQLSTEQYRSENSSDSDSYILIHFSLKENTGQTKKKEKKIIATLKANGEFQLKKGHA